MEKHMIHSGMLLKKNLSLPEKFTDMSVCIGENNSFDGFMIGEEPMR